MYLNLVLSITVILIYSVESEYTVTITNDGPIDVGGTIIFRAKLYDDSGRQPTDNFEYIWQDNAIPTHTQTFHSESGTSAWSVTYDKDKYSPGLYEVQVDVKREFALIPFSVASARQTFNITTFLNGHIDIVQGNMILGGDYIDLKTEVLHQVVLNSADAKELTPNETVATFWFINCKYMGVTSDLTFVHNYTKEDADKAIDVQVWMEIGPPVNATKPHPFNNATNEIENVTVSNATTTTMAPPTTKPPVMRGCGEDPVIPRDPKKFYGMFKRTVTPTLPVSIGNLNGSTWLKNGALLQMELTCSGSSPFYHCVRFIKGEYNSTGNETCTNARETQNCKIAITRLLNPGSHFTILFIIGNKVSNVVKPVGVTMYSEPTLPQLSVIIVPITCSSIAVVIIIFGVAYYIQSRNRYTIEVADFDFTRRNDTEYKTFKERLRDAVSSAFTRVHEEYSEEGPIGNVWSPARKNHPRQGLLLDSDSETVDS